jgi:hypothetical protein
MAVRYDLGEQKSDLLPLSYPISVLVAFVSLPFGKDDENRRTPALLTLYEIAAEITRNRRKKQKASVVTDIVIKHLARLCFLETGVEMPTGLNFEAFYVSWISLKKKKFVNLFRVPLALAIVALLFNQANTRTERGTAQQRTEWQLSVDCYFISLHDG